MERFPSFEAPKPEKIEEKIVPILYERSESIPIFRSRTLDRIGAKSRILDFKAKSKILMKSGKKK